MKNVLEYLENSARAFPHKAALEEESRTCTFGELQEASMRIGSAMAGKIRIGTPVAVFMEKGIACLRAFFGIVYAGGFYVLLNPELPPARLRQIQDILQAPYILTDEEHRAAAQEIFPSAAVLLAEELGEGPIREDALAGVRSRMVDTDPLYGMFTSGSTGVPKGVVVSHGSVIDFINTFTALFQIREDDVIGNQAPFDFDVSVKDIYSSVMTGAGLVLIPKEYFSTPPRLLDFLCEKNVTTLTWAVSALTLVSSLKGLRYRIPEKVNKIMFSGEAMPPKQLRIWQEALPDARFVNLYGPTEITCNCTYYPVVRMYEDGEKIPAGNAFPGRTVFLLDEDDIEIAEPGRQGEICVAGESLAQGYYRNEEQTKKQFVMYPVGGGEPQRIYRTGDMGYYDEKGRIIFAGRKDFQIKHMGHRIELEEIESAMNAVENVQRSCCVFQEEKNRIAGFYMGEAEPSEVRRKLKEKLPVYMVPPKLIRMQVMPLNKNGKTDRAYLKRWKE